MCEICFQLEFGVLKRKTSQVITEASNTISWMSKLIGYTAIYFILHETQQM
jgi:hypothetical protein